MKRIYMAHSAHERERGKVNQQRLEELDFSVYNPFYPDIPELYRDDVKALDEGRIQPWSISDKDRSLWIIDIDYRAVRKADIVVCFYPTNGRRTVGIPCEMAFAWLLHIPIYSVVPEDMAGHPWIVGMSERVFISDDDLFIYLEKK